MPVDISTMVRHVRQYAHSCPEPVIIDALRLAAIEFAEKTQALTYSTSEIVIGNFADIDITPPSGMLVERVDNVNFNGKPVAIKSRQALDQLIPDWRTRTGDTLEYCFLKEQDEQWYLTIVPIPETTNRWLNIELILKPTIDATTLDSVFANKYQRHLINGAAAALLIQPKQSWSDPNLSLLKRSEFNSAIGRVAGEVLTGFSNEKMEVTPRSFGF
jgi:hypothetical protein